MKKNVAALMLFTIIVAIAAMHIDANNDKHAVQAVPAPVATTTSTVPTAPTSTSTTTGAITVTTTTPKPVVLKPRPMATTTTTTLKSAVPVPVQVVPVNVAAPTTTTTTAVVNATTTTTTRPITTTTTVYVQYVPLFSSCEVVVYSNATRIDAVYFTQQNWPTARGFPYPGPMTQAQCDVFAQKWAAATGYLLPAYATAYNRVN